MIGDVALAAEHVAAGRPDEAIDVLARATAGGDLDASLALGRRLLVGDRAPHLPQDGIRFMFDAMVAGHAEAALRLAPLAALGAYVEPSWSHALGLLVTAAERGSETARGQLRLLTAPGEHAASADWRGLAARIDLTFWLTAPPGRNLSTRPLVRCFAGVVPEPVCAWLRGRTDGVLRRALIYDPNQGGDVADHMRNNSIAVFDLADLDLVQVLVQHRMAIACGLPARNAEGPTVLHYAVGEQITNHYDFINVRTENYDEYVARNGERVITFLVYLNDDYDGGETDFPKIGVRHKGRQGDGLFFTNALPTGKPDLRAVHAGLPPTRGEKWLLSQFFRNREALGARAEKVG
jgi:type IV secretory pathway protease TraF